MLLPPWVVDSGTRVGFIMIGQELFGKHYARTLWEWRTRMVSNKDVIIKKHGMRLYRMWEVYFAHCEASYRLGIAEKAHWVFYKPLEQPIHTKPFGAWKDKIEVVWQ